MRFLPCFVFVSAPIPYFCLGIGPHGSAGVRGAAANGGREARDAYRDIVLDNGRGRAAGDDSAEGDRSVGRNGRRKRDTVSVRAAGDGHAITGGHAGVADPPVDRQLPGGEGIFKGLVNGGR